MRAKKCRNFKSGMRGGIDSLSNGGKVDTVISHSIPGSAAGAIHEYLALIPLPKKQTVVCNEKYLTTGRCSKHEG